MANAISLTPNPELSHIYHRLDELRSSLPDDPAWWTSEQEQTFLLLQLELAQAKKGNRGKEQFYPTLYATREPAAD